MKVSNCCGSSGEEIYSFVGFDTSYYDMGICGNCKESCDYVEEQAEEGSLIYDMQELKKLLDNHKKLTNE